MKIFDKKTIKELESILGIKIKTKEFFERAFFHRSYLTCSNEAIDIDTNERLEFLGDAILGMVVGEYLFFNFPDKLEGDLTKTRAKIVSTKSLIFCAKKLNLEKFILLSTSAKKSLDSGKESILADLMEAVIAAIYLDYDYEKTKKFIINNIVNVISDTNLMDDKNYKSKLMESVQAEGIKFPEYKVLNESGPDHSKEFTIGVYINEKLVAKGIGHTKKDAEQMAAMNALKKINL